MGLIPISQFSDKIAKLVDAKFGYIPNLKELNQLTGKTLVAVASNVTKMKCEYYSHITRPDLSCVDAVKLSCNLPLIFQRIKYNEDAITDGGFMDNFPIKFVDDGISKILGIVTVGSDFSQPDDTFIGYFHRIMSMPIYSNTMTTCKSCEQNTTLIKMTWNNASIFQFTMNQDNKTNMFVHGFKCAEFDNQTEFYYVEGWDEIKI